jgi:hypothetical protein
MKRPRKERGGLPTALKVAKLPPSYHFCYSCKYSAGAQQQLADASHAVRASRIETLAEMVVHPH